MRNLNYMIENALKEKIREAVREIDIDELITNLADSLMNDEIRDFEDYVTERIQYKTDYQGQSVRDIADEIIDDEFEL